MAGLGWAVKLEAGHALPGPGRAGRAAPRPLPRLLAGFAADAPEVVLLGRETIYRDGQRVGWLGSAGYRLHGRPKPGLRLCAQPGGRRSRPCPERAPTSSRSRASASPPRSSLTRPMMPKVRGCVLDLLDRCLDALVGCSGSRHSGLDSFARSARLSRSRWRRRRPQLDRLVCSNSSFARSSRSSRSKRLNDVPRWVANRRCSCRGDTPSAAAACANDGGCSIERCRRSMAASTVGFRVP